MDKKEKKLKEILDEIHERELSKGELIDTVRNLVKEYLDLASDYANLYEYSEVLYHDNQTMRKKHNEPELREELGMH